MASELQPTLILQDLVMPEIQGLDLVPQYRLQESTKDTPLIVLSTKEEADTKAEAFARGANDYLVKLPDPVELTARIRYHSRGYIALLERNEAFAALERSEHALRSELAKAADYVRSLLPERMDEPVKTDWEFIPSVALGGDAFDYQWLDDDTLAIFLVDVSGHGVGPALLSVSVLNALRSCTLPSTDFKEPSSVLGAINRAYPFERHNFMFFTLWYGVYHKPTRTLRYAGAGHPPALIVPSPDSGSAELRQLESRGPIAGIDGEAEYPCEQVELRPGDRLFVYSDGVFEIPTSETEMWEFDDFLDFMRQPPPAETSKIEHLVAYAREMQGRDEFSDDFSIVELRFD
jgi:sigma-B regulation protein RsbU (phosphoserine phosphatase)